MLSSGSFLGYMFFWPFSSSYIPQLFLVFHLSCASGYLPSLSFYGLTYFHILYVVAGVLFSIIYLRFFTRALVGDAIFDFFCFFVCFAMLIALGWITSVMFLFRLSMSSCSSSAVNLFFQFELKRVLLRSTHLSVNSCSCILV